MAKIEESCRNCKKTYITYWPESYQEFCSLGCKVDGGKMSLLEFAKTELDLIGMDEDNSNDMNRAMRNHILHMVTEFSEEGHSGFSASYALGLLMKLFDYKPLSPLTGDDSEWVEHDNDLFQNKRYSAVFKTGKTGKPYDINGRVFYETYLDEDGTLRKSYFTSGDSVVDIEFPYTPTTEYVEASRDPS